MGLDSGRLSWSSGAGNCPPTRIEERVEEMKRRRCYGCRVKSARLGWHFCTMKCAARWGERMAALTKDYYCWSCDDWHDETVRCGSSEERARRRDKDGAVEAVHA